MNNQIKCIVVEDYEPLNSIYSNLLNYEEGICVVGRAFDSTGLFDILKTQPADVILLDIEMKGRMEGLEACKRISLEYPEIKVVILTCHEEEAMILSTIESGAVDYVLKTSSLSLILDSVRAAYNNKSSLNPYVAFVVKKRVKEFNSMKASLIYVMNILSVLTDSELDILRLVLQGKKNKDIAKIRNVELATVKAHVGRILRKFDKERMTEVIQSIKSLDLQNFVESLHDDKIASK